MGKTLEQVEQWQNESALKESPLLDGVAKELEALARDMFTPPIAFQTDNGADVMALSFATKQLEHMRSVRALIAAGSQRDAQLIARTMLEAQGILRWAFNRAPERTELWFWYGAILDWRQMAENKRDGVEVDPADEAELKPYVDQHGPNYYRSNIRKRLEEAQKTGTTYILPEDPWHPSDWTEVNFRSMFEELGDERLYESFYRRTSEWAHSGPRAILIAAGRERTDPAEWGTDQFTDDDVQSGVWALGIACESLLRSLDILNTHFSLGHGDRLMSIDDKLEAMRTESLASQP
jgi:Family of unknown function (DUF5677)